VAPAGELRRRWRSPRRRGDSRPRLLLPSSMPLATFVPTLPQEVDVQGELTAARASIDKLAKQVALLGRDQEVRQAASCDRAATAAACCRCSRPALLQEPSQLV
jgi:hypothetical protein